MEPEQRTEREITYKVGWKRGKIALNQGKLPTSEPEHEADTISAPRQFVGYVWNERWIWRRAGRISEGLLKSLLYAFPIAAFGLSLWLVYLISIQP